MRIKAFTLVELLAVIVILGVIALIATPIVLNIIEQTKYSAFKISVQEVFKAYEIYELENDEYVIGEKISVTDENFPLESKLKEGIVYRGEDENIEIENVSDGMYCAGGSKNQYSIIKGTCDKLNDLEIKVNINRITTNSITVTVEANDESGIKGIYYSLNDKDYKESENVYTFDKLELNKTYTIYVKVKNRNNVETIVKSEVTTLNIDMPTYAIDNSGWSNGKKVTINYPSGEELVYEYSLDKGMSWNTAIKTQEVTFTSNGSIIARVLDGTNTVTANTFTVDKIDTTKPEIDPEMSKWIVSTLQGYETKKEITVYAFDDESGIKEYSFDNGVTWQTEDTYTFTTNGIYTLKVKDNAGNISQLTIKINTICSGDNCNMLRKGLVPVKYNGSNWVVADSSKTDWYNYNNQEWANAVILNEGVIKNIGETIDVSNEVKGMFVWIPRYEYKIEGTYGKGGTSASSPGEIEINLIPKSKTTASSGYRIHPAFNFGGIQLSGIWVGKFETSHETLSSSKLENNLGCSNENCTNADGLRILPNVASLRYNSVSNMFYATRSMTRSGNGFGLNSSNIDSHMMKNSEWGAVAYLSQSKYGKYGNSKYSGAEKEVRINNCSNYITGIGASNQNDDRSTETCTTNIYTTTNGQAASTTGNITGIYDMSGGVWEYVMGNLSNTIGNSGFNNYPEAKYYDSYTSTNTSSNSIELSKTACNNGICYGHALSEIKNWYEDYAYLVKLDRSWSLRGGCYLDKALAGVFASGHNGGEAYSSGGAIRVILAPTAND